MIRVLLVLALLTGCASMERDFTALVKQEGAAVVAVNAGYGTNFAMADAPRGEAQPDDAPGPGFGDDAPGPLLGSGFLISKDGHVVTNAHLIADAVEGGIVVRLRDGREFSAALIGADPASDIALLKIDGKGLPYVRLGDSRRVQPGQWVAAIGSPLGLDSSATAGIVSATGRSLPDEGYVQFIQTDVPVNPGNSGGPLFNRRGEVVGVNTSFYSASGGFMGISFAVPIDTAMEVVRELRESGTVRRGTLGVRLQELTPDLARALRVHGKGALVVEVVRGGPSERAGLRPADVIVSFGGKPVHSNATLVDLAAHTRPGSSVEMLFLRNGIPAKTAVTVGESRSGLVLREEKAPIGVDPLGLEVAAISRLWRERLGLEAGLLVLQAEGTARRAGLYPGDVVLSINGAPTTTVKQFENFVAESRGTVALLVQRDGVRRFVALRAPHRP
jgi:serine protease Do